MSSNLIQKVFSVCMYGVSRNWFHNQFPFYNCGGIAVVVIVGVYKAYLPFYSSIHCTFFPSRFLLFLFLCSLFFTMRFTGYRQSLPTSFSVCTWPLACRRQHCACACLAVCCHPGSEGWESRRIKGRPPPFDPALCSDTWLVSTPGDEHQVWQWIHIMCVIYHLFYSSRTCIT